MEEAAAEDEEQNRSMYQQASTHHRKHVFKIDFQPGEFLIDRRDVEYMAVEAGFWVEVTSKKICSKLELVGQGRAFSFEPVELQEGRTLTVDVVQRI